MNELVKTLGKAASGGINEVGNGDSDLVGKVTGILNAVIAVLGIVAVIVIIMGGIGYMTSFGISLCCRSYYRWRQLYDFLRRCWQS